MMKHHLSYGPMLSRSQHGARVLTALIALSLLSTTALNAQIPAVDALLQKVKGIGIWAGPAWVVRSDELQGSRAWDVGIEGSISLGEQAGWSFDLNVSYEHFAGLESEQSGFDLRGSVEALPGATLYVSPPLALGPGDGSSVYVGINVGPAKLVSTRAYTTTGVEFTVEANTTQFGWAVGAVDLNSGFFIEFTYRDRTFESLAYSTDDGTAAPVDWPRSLNANALALRFGSSTSPQ